MPVTINDVTTGTVDGTGTFDKLMQVTRSHIQEEYDAGRIRDEDYSQVLLGGLQSSMAQAIQFEIAKAGVLQTEAQTLLVGEQVNQAIAQTANVVAEGLNIPKQGVLLDTQKTQLDVEIVNLGKQGLLLDEQLNQLAQAILKVQAEIGLLNQKTATETAQTTDLATGVVGKQQTLYTRQADGFLRDAEQKAAKIFADAYSVRRSTDSALAGPEGLFDPEITKVTNKLKEGIGITS